MKTLVTLGVVIAFLTSSCSKPTAEVSISNPHPNLNEKFHVENQSRGGDITYIRMNGEGIMDQNTKITKDNLITDTRFNFRYTEPGTYHIEVFVESKSLFGGMENTTVSRNVVVTDPNARPAEPKPEPVEIKRYKGIPNANTKYIADPTAVDQTPDIQDVPNAPSDPRKPVQNDKKWDR